MSEKMLVEAEIRAFLHMSFSRKQISEIVKTRSLQMWSQIVAAAGKTVLSPEASVMRGDGVELAIDCGSRGAVLFMVRGDGTVKVSRSGRTWNLAGGDSIPEEILADIFPPRKT
jgi:hypothetical protein